MNNTTSPNKPDPALEQAAKRLNRTELSPLEEVMFKSWATANQVDDPDSPDHTLDFRSIYKQTGGKVLPPNQLLGRAEKASAIDTIMNAQKAHDEASPIKMLMSNNSLNSLGGSGDTGGAPVSGGMASGGQPGGDGNYPVGG